MRGARSSMEAEVSIIAESCGRDELGAVCAHQHKWMRREQKCVSYASVVERRWTEGLKVESDVGSTSNLSSYLDGNGSKY